LASGQFDASSLASATGNQSLSRGFFRARYHPAFKGLEEMELFARRPTNGSKKWHSNNDRWQVGLVVKEQGGAEANACLL
jgi:hypothetical protein